MTQTTYHDFEIRVEKEGDRYRARVIQSPAGSASAVFERPYCNNETELKYLLLQMNVGARRTRRNPTIETEAAQELGSELFNALFSGEISECFRKSMAQACSAENSGLRLKLRFLQVPELAGLPWEYLFDKSSHWFPAQSHLTPVVRYVDAGPVQPLPVKLPLKIRHYRK